MSDVVGLFVTHRLGYAGARGIPSSVGNGREHRYTESSHRSHRLSRIPTQTLKGISRRVCREFVVSTHDSIHSHSKIGDATSLARCLVADA